MYDKYDGDFGLIEERWADKEDNNKISPIQMEILSDYIVKLKLEHNVNYSDDLINQFRSKINEYEKYIDPEVITLIKMRIKNNKI